MTLNIITITDSNDPRLSVYKNIKEKDIIGREKQFIAEGKVVLSVLLHAKHFSAQSMIIVEARLPGMMPLLQQTQPDCLIFCVSQNIMDMVAGFHVHRGILGIGKRIEQPSLIDFITQLPKNAVIPILCGISNHDNMGSIFRNSAAFAANGIIIDKTSCDPLYRKSIRVSVGAALKIPYTQGETIETIVDALDKAHFEIYSLTPSAENILHNAKKSARTALIFGTEGDGLPIEILKRTKTLRIPIAQDFDSLNVATSTGLALSHFADKARLK